MRSKLTLLVALCAILVQSGALVMAQAVTALPAATLPATARATASSPAGDYLGKLQVGAFALRLGLKLEKTEAGWKGTLDSIDQNSVMLIDTVELKDDALTFAIKVINGSFSGTVAEDFASIDGKWTQNGQSLPLKFERVAEAVKLNRPQEPKPPYPYIEEKITFENAAGKVRLAGTLTKPKAGGLFPAVILITGSGPQDRNEQLMGHKPFLVLADHLTRAGIAVLRYDDRGVGESTGDFAKAVVDDFVTDAQAALAFMRNRADIDTKHLGLVGHSEGGVVAPLVAGKDPNVAFIVLLAGVGVPMEELLIRQWLDIARVTGTDDATLKRLEGTNQKIFRIVKTVEDKAEAEKQLRVLIDEAVAMMSEAEKKAAKPEMLNGQIEMLLSPWFRALTKYDPAPALAKVKCPVLALNGSKDLQVASKENLAGIKAGVLAGGNKNVEIVEYPGLNHLFQHCETGSIAVYATIEETMSPEVMEKIANWIKASAQGN